MAKEREAKGASDTNAQIITTDSGRIYSKRQTNPIFSQPSFDVIMSPT